ncbi:MAG: hypothetical protein JEZ10_05375 [Verrucomicrobia bacterium]|nr:hypothetical protein [Verrucomicrobiota bacterium]
MRSTRKTKRLLTRLLLITLCAAVWFAVRTGREPPPAQANIRDDSLVPDEPALSESNTLPGVHKVIWEWSPVGLPDVEQESLRKNGIFRVDPKNLSQYEGSYTSDDILSGSGGAASLQLNSRWLYKGSNRPQVRMQIRKNL